MAFKWTEEMVNTLSSAAVQYGDADVPTETVAELAEALNVSTRSVTAKLRALGFSAAKKAEAAPKWEEALATQLVDLVNAGTTDVEIAEIMGKTTRQIRGKALSMGIVDKLNIVKKEPTEVVKKYTADEEALITQMVENGAFLEDIVAELSKVQLRTVAQVRGKLLSMKLKAPQREHKAAPSKIYTEEVAAKVLELAKTETAEAIANLLGLKVVGLKSFLGKHGVKTSDMVTKTAKKYSDEDIATMTALAAAGKTLDEAAAEMGRTVPSIRVVAGKHKIVFNKATA